MCHGSSSSVTPRTSGGSTCDRPELRRCFQGDPLVSVPGGGGTRSAGQPAAMGSHGPGRRRTADRERLTAEDDALNQVVREVRLLVQAAVTS